MPLPSAVAGVAVDAEAEGVDIAAVVEVALRCTVVEVVVDHRAPLIWVVGMVAACRDQRLKRDLRCRDRSPRRGRRWPADHR